MSKERELLRRVKVLLEFSNMEPLQRQTDLIVGEIKYLLAQSEQEPFKPDWVNYRQGVEDAKREPLSDYATYDMFRASKQAVTASCYWAGIRDAEKAHGITRVEDTKREPLSDDKLAAMAVEDEFLFFCSEDEFIEIARVIEKAHGIVEQK